MTDINIKQFRAETQSIEVTVNDDDGEPIDLTAGSVVDVHLHVATGLKEYGETKFELTAENLNDNGNADFTVGHEDTEDLTPGNYLYEVWVEYENSTNYTAEVGKFFVKPRVDQ